MLPSLLVAVLATVSSGRILTYDIHDQHHRRLVEQQPDHIAFYGAHHQTPDIDCNNLTSKEIHRRIAQHMDRVVELLASNDFQKLEKEYPSIVAAFGTDRKQLAIFINDFQLAIDKLELNGLVLSSEGAADTLRHVSLVGLQELAKQYGVNFPRRLTVENLRVLRADLLHLGEHGGDLYQAVSDLIDCVYVEQFQTPHTTDNAVLDVGYSIHSEQDAHVGQSSGTMINDINTLLDDENLKHIFHPLGMPHDSEPLRDPYFPYQWYLGGPPEQPYGADFIRAWQFLAQSESFDGVTRDHFPKSPISGELDLNIAIVDMGCGMHDHLLYDASNPICQNDNMKVGSGDELNHDAEIIHIDAEMSEDQKEGEKVHEKHYGADYCYGPTNASDPHLINEGHETMKESYFKDPSNHGTSTASIIGAGWNDDSGIAGLCPFCAVKCIKISADEMNNQQVNMAGIFRSLEFLAAFSDKYPISNHSYGGFFLDSKEVEGHRRLSEVGHLAVTAAGNYGCDIDPLASAYGAFDNGVPGIGTEVVHKDLLAKNTCSNTKGEATHPMMPASVQFPTKLQVGAISVTGDLSQFSNWGKQGVSLMAPGETLVSLRARDAKQVKAGNDEIIIQHGTSFSSPIVSAAAALIYRRMEQLCHRPTAETIVDILKSTVTVVPTLTDLVQSGGTLNVYDALKSIKNLC